MKKILLITLAFVAGSTSCTQMNKVMESWVGSHYNSVIADWGPPNHIMSDGQDGQIMTWSENASVMFPGSSTTNVYGDTAYTTQTPGIIHNFTKYRTFWMDKKGIIYRWSWRGL